MLIKNLRYSVLLFFVIFFVAVSASAQRQHWFVNPGIKLGYAFGPNGGFIFGTEVSLTTIVDNRVDAWGMLVSYESIGKMQLIHGGIEYFPRIFYGASIGPSFLLDSKKDDVALTTTVFGGLFLLPYYRLTILPGRFTLHEVGTFFKVPVPLQREDFSLGG